MNNNFKEKFDLALSVGLGCRAAHQLDKLKMRFFTSPLDWMVSRNFDKVISLFENGFSTFFDEIREDSTGDKTHQGVYDTKNEILCMHHFPLNADINTYKSTFCKLMQKRYKRMNYFIKNSQNVLFVSERQIPPEKFMEFLQKIDKIYPNKKLALINIRNQKVSSPVKLTFEQNNLKVIDVTADDNYPGNNPRFDWMGNDMVWKTAFQDIKLSNRFLFYRIPLSVWNFARYNKLYLKFFKEMQ